MFGISICAMLVASGKRLLTLEVFSKKNASARLFLPGQLPHITGLPPFNRLYPTKAIIKPASYSRNCMDRRWVVKHTPASGGLGTDTSLTQTVTTSNAQTT